MEEEFVSGFCKAQNQTRTVLCEFDIDETGKRMLADSDCAYPDCPHAGGCLLMGQITAASEG